MTHEEFESIAALDAVGAASIEEERELRAHLETCADCRRIRDDYAEAATMLAQGLDPVAPPPEARGRILDSIDSPATDNVVEMSPPRRSGVADRPVALRRLRIGRILQGERRQLRQVGVLGDLYALAQVAYVGGGFHSAGLHSVLEPAAFAAPVLFGPRHEASRDAGLLIRAGGGVALSDTDAFAARLTQWLTDPDSTRTAGSAALGVVQSVLGECRRREQPRRRRRHGAFARIARERCGQRR